MKVELDLNPTEILRLNRVLNAVWTNSAKIFFNCEQDVALSVRLVLDAQIETALLNEALRGKL